MWLAVASSSPCGSWTERRGDCRPALPLHRALVSAAVDRVRPKDRFRRHNAAYVRQGEWFFVPAPGLEPEANLVLRNEPLTRGRGKAHVMEFVYRRGGETVWANRQVYARGAVRHRDHATIVLPDWHRVVMNTEHEAQAMRNVVFLD